VRRGFHHADLEAARRVADIYRETPAGPRYEESSALPALYGWAATDPGRLASPKAFIARTSATRQEGLKKGETTSESLASISPLNVRRTHRQAPCLRVLH
jgi:hypothetical protein